MAEGDDLVLRDVTIVDGTGAASVRGDVAVRGERITHAGAPLDEARVARAGSVVEGRGLVASPGFVDVHTHDDFAVLLHPEMAFKVCGGVTTCIVGNCSMGAAPHRIASVMARYYHPGARLPDWEGYAGYLALVDRESPSVNVGALVGHGNLRATAMGNRPEQPSARELGTMSALLEEGLEAGALGLSSGLVYEPSGHAGTEELVALARLMAGTGARYATHLRDEADRLLEAVDEALEIGARAGVPVQLSHHKAAGRTNWGRVRDSLARVDGANRSGRAVALDQYPYTASSTILSAVVAGRSLVPGAAGGIGAVEGDDVVVASAPAHPGWEGRAVGSFARDWDLGAQEAAERLLEEEPLATVIVHNLSEQDVRTVLAHPATMIGSDGIPNLEGRPHPRLYGTFARVLGRYARDEHVLGLEEAVHRMTGLPARTFGLSGRGELRPGAWADVVIFDPDRIEDRASYEEPQRTPAGIHHVLVNGTAVVRDGRHTGARPGRSLRRS